MFNPYKRLANLMFPEVNNTSFYRTKDYLIQELQYIVTEDEAFSILEEFSKTVREEIIDIIGRDILYKKVFIDIYNNQDVKFTTIEDYYMFNEQLNKVGALWGDGVLVQDIIRDLEYELDTTLGDYDITHRLAISVQDNLPIFGKKENIVGIYYNYTRSWNPVLDGIDVVDISQYVDY